MHFSLPLAACSTWVNSFSNPEISGYLVSMMSSRKWTNVNWPSMDLVELSCNVHKVCVVLERLRQKPALAKATHTAGPYPCFPSKKRPGAFMPSPQWHVCTVRVKCLAQDQDTMTPASARAQTTQESNALIITPPCRTVAEITWKLESCKEQWRSPITRVYRKIVQRNTINSKFSDWHF